jgi:hypothetical protein
MQACGMFPKDTLSSNDKKSDFNSNLTNKKAPQKFPSTSNRCSHSSISSNNNNNTTKVFNIDNRNDSSANNSFDDFKTPITSTETPSTSTTSMSRAFMDKINRETFDQTRSRLHGIFQYEKYKVNILQ